MRPSLLIACWVATLAASFLVGWGLTPRPEPQVQVLEQTVTVTNTVIRAAEPSGRTAATPGSEAWKDAGAASAAAFAAAGAGASTADASAIFRMKDPASRAQAFAKLLAGLSPANAQAIMAMFLKKGFKTTREEEEIRMLAEAWAAVDGKSAVEYLNALPYNERPQNTIRATLAEWAMHDLDAAEAWARSATTNVPNHYMIGVIAGAANVNLSRAETLLYEMPYGRERGDAMAYVAGAHLENGNADAMNWATSVQDPRLEQASIRKVAAQVALTDPLLAANWVVQNSNEEQMPYNVSTLARQWSYSDAEAAANWAFGLPPGPAQDAAIAATLPSLAVKNPQAVEKMLVSQPPSKATDPARVTLAREYTSTDPVRALAWANTVTDPHARDRTTQRIMDTWQKNDPAAAAKFVQPKTP